MTLAVVGNPRTPCTALGDDEDIVPDGQCACMKRYVHTYDPRITFQYRCIVVPKTGYQQPPQGETAEPSVQDRDKSICDNCRTCDPLNCIKTYSLTETDSGSVSGTIGFSIELTKQINVALAGKVGIRTTAEFSAGYTSTTTVSVTRSIECGGVIPPCRLNIYTIEQLGIPVHARQPLTHAWQYRWKLPYQDWSGWTTYKSCNQTVGWATLSGQRACGTRCVGITQQCGPCPECHPTPR